VSGLLLAVLLCARASAAVVETAPEAAPSASVGAAGASALSPLASPIALVPGGATLVPALSPSSIRSILGVPPSAGRVTLAPEAAPIIPAAAAPGAAPADADPSPAAAPAEALPPPLPAPSAPAFVPMAPIGAAASRSAVAGMPEAVRASGSGTPDAAPSAPRTPEEAAADGRAFWDQATERGRWDLAALFGAGRRAGAALRGRAPVAAASGPASSVEDGPLRDAVSAGVPASAALARPWSAVRGPAGVVPATAASVRAGEVDADPATSFPARVERLTLSVGSGLVVRVGAALRREFLSSEERDTRAGLAASARRAAPSTSTQWLELRGLIETASYAPVSSARADAADEAPSIRTAAASWASAPTAAGVETRAFARRAAEIPLRSDSGSPLAWWALAFLPAALALLRDPLR
jgi:hypothetical protein